nr:hypothetical protein Iba_chr13bCG9350 [Ipomoea batatas]
MISSLSLGVHKAVLFCLRVLGDRWKILDRLSLYHDRSRAQVRILISVTSSTMARRSTRGTRGILIDNQLGGWGMCLVFGVQFRLNDDDCYNRLCQSNPPTIRALETANHHSSTGMQYKAHKLGIAEIFGLRLMIGNTTMPVMGVFKTSKSRANHDLPSEDCRPPAFARSPVLTGAPTTTGTELRPTQMMMSATADLLCYGRFVHQREGHGCCNRHDRMIYVKGCQPRPDRHARKLTISSRESGWREEDDEPGGFLAHYLTTSERERYAGEAICDNESKMKCWIALLILYPRPRFFWFFTTDDTNPGLNVALRRWPGAWNRSQLRRRPGSRCGLRRWSSRNLDNGDWQVAPLRDRGERCRTTIGHFLRKNGQNVRQVGLVHRHLQGCLDVVLHRPSPAVKGPSAELVHQVFTDRSSGDSSKNGFSGLLASADVTGEQDGVGEDLLSQIRALQDPSPGLLGRLELALELLDPLVPLGKGLLKGRHLSTMDFVPVFGPGKEIGDGVGHLQDCKSAVEVDKTNAE